MQSLERQSSSRKNAPEQSLACRRVFGECIKLCVCKEAVACSPRIFLFVRAEYINTQRITTDGIGSAADRTHAVRVHDSAFCNPVSVFVDTVGRIKLLGTLDDNTPTDYMLPFFIFFSLLMRGETFSRHPSYFYLVSSLFNLIPILPFNATIYHNHPFLYELLYSLKRSRL